MNIYEYDQRRLNNYLNRNHNKEEIGKIYERYIGYLYEKDEYLVTYSGIREGFEDLGRDLIAKKKNEILIIQCKNWSKESIIYERHIYQLFGTAEHFQKEFPDKKVKPVFITTADLSTHARTAADSLKIEVRVIPLRKDYPMIKCNINSKGKLYHLPCDDASTYDNIQITERTGEAFVYTIEEAIKLGFESPYKQKSFSQKKRAS